jgi:hypothetical protein
VRKLAENKKLNVGITQNTNPTPDMTPLRLALPSDGVIHTMIVGPPSMNIYIDDLNWEKRIKRGEKLDGK